MLALMFGVRDRDLVRHSYRVGGAVLRVRYTVGVAAQAYCTAFVEVAAAGGLPD